MRDILLGYGIFALYSAAAVYAVYVLILILSYKQVAKMARSSLYAKYRELSGSEFVPAVSILVPSYNEELTILETVRSLLSLNYPAFEVIVVNDGSKDGTLRVLTEEYGLLHAPRLPLNGELEASPVKGIYHNPAHPKLYVVDKDNGGKEDALNVGINVSRHPLVLTVDADSLLEKDALLRLIRIYMENPEETVAVGGNVRVANGCTIEDGVVKEVRLPKQILPMFQNIEYLKAFLGGRIGWSSLNSLLIVSGAFGLFRKDLLIEVGGYRGGFPGEDMNVIIKLHRHMLDRKLPYRISFCPDAVCWTQAPDSLDILGNQRKRWSRGTIKNMWLFRSMLFIPKYKALGFLSMPYTFFFEMLHPYLRFTGFMALLGYCLMEMTDFKVLLLFMLSNMLISILFSCGALWIEELSFRRYPKVKDLLKLMAFSVLMTLGYEQLNVLWKFMGHIDFIRNKNSWGTMVRKSWKEDVLVTPKAVRNQTI